jgi:hypothetical protein
MVKGTETPRTLMARLGEAEENLVPVVNVDLFDP